VFAQEKRSLDALVAPHAAVGDAHKYVLEVTRSAAQASEVVRAAWSKYKGKDNPDLRLLDLDKVAALIEADFPTRLYYVPLRGSLFDTHVNQASPHDRQLLYCSDAIAGFFQEMKRIGRADDVVMYVHSEFGRRVPENTSLGTDHGTAQVNFVIGNAVKGGLYGTPPNLTDLVLGDNLAAPRLPSGVRVADPRLDGRPTPRKVLGQIVPDDGPSSARRNAEHAMSHPHALVSRTAGLEGRPHAARAADWNYDRAAHLLTHAGSAARRPRSRSWPIPGSNARMRSLVPLREPPEPDDAAVRRVGPLGSDAERLSGERPEATIAPRTQGRSRASRTKPVRQPARAAKSDRFFYWLRATMLETRRLGYWWANRMLQTTHPVEQKMALLWHGHFATHENKVRDYRKMLQQIDLFERGATGNLRDLTIKVAQNPAMLYFLDAQYNVKGAPNENFAREVMELFTMGVGNYTEKDVRECARAFTGWYFDNLTFKIDPAKHDAGTEDVPRAHRRLRRRRTC
jgi:hypothetical protein